MSVCSLFSDVLALPIFKQEESNLPPDSDNKILPFQYVLCAATSPAVKLHDETLTYLNQGELLVPPSFALSRQSTHQSMATLYRIDAELHLL